MARPQILFLDAYDSFTNNIVSLLTTLLNADVHVLPIDSTLLNPGSPSFKQEWAHELSHYHAVVCGPGPGSPEVGKDVGLMRAIWDLDVENLVPVLGVCLGFQSLVLSAGGNVRRLRRGLHGMVRDIEHDKPAAMAVKGDIFRSVGQFKATLYHSLCADVGQDEVEESSWETQRWDIGTEELQPLAWATEDREDGTERILMAAKHRMKPFWGVQYHPESICTQSAGDAVIRNWFAEAMRWNESTKRRVRTGESLLARDATQPSLVSQVLQLRHERGGLPWTESTSTLAAFGLDSQYTCKTIQLPEHVKVPDVVEALRSTDAEHIILDSANSDKMATGAADVRGRHSIIALDVGEALRIEYHVGDAHATARIPDTQEGADERVETIPFEHHENIWQLLSDFRDKRRLNIPDVTQSPFKGGFMGYVTYEMGLNGIDVPLPTDRGHSRPDLCFAWVTRSIVIDHVLGVLHVQHLQNRKLNADFWIDATIASLEASPLWTDRGLARGAPLALASPPVIATPEPEEYERKVEKCQDFIAAGESYELCLTDQTTIRLPRASAAAETSKDKAWDMYRTLRARQPAPFGSFLRLGAATLVSSSPERFLEYTSDGICSMRPMKGTVRKSDAVSTLEQAEALLHIPKEEAENLMIVDLVRHDLHGVCGSGNVTVPHLMRVEEYASVFQMITVVDAHLSGGEGGYTGLDVLAASLPPGSMTGAPKKRSCELLRELEGRRERSLYSGVVGYMDVTGKGDWSVTIRTVFRWDDESEGDSEVWRIGAGGAVTILSTPEGEREEMFTKLAGPLGMFSASSA
ncbi:aminodeoxychorismate synthase [Plectosphaerella cucumerina]|uniref:aminodeoxychorismate synthase n=1 Tax=Plectosphaerella cucumerina TaxID=40658 RepID=A0A8K0TIZ7_9PEZI|nr:aminodeoxychorismate synthase [Plectosphaerella cucumerina]